MVETLEDNITRITEAPHKLEVFLSSSADEEGEKIKDQYAPFYASISKMANKIAYAKIAIEDGDVAEQDFAISNTDDFAPGSFITLKMGDVNNVETVFSGLIVKHGIKVRKNRKSILTLDCRDIATTLAITPSSRYFDKDKKDSDAFKDLLKEKDLPTTGIESTDIEHEGLVKYNATDWDFIRKRANAAGQLVYTENGTLTTITPTIAAKKDYTLSYGDNLIEFEAEVDARNQFKEVTLNIWDSAKQDFVESDQKNVSGVKLEKPGNLSVKDLSKITNKDGLEINYTGDLNDGDRKNKLKSELIKSRLARVIGRAQIKQPTRILPGKTVELVGVGKRFKGLTYITSARYEFSNNAWTTDLQFGLPRNWNMQEKGDSETDPGIPTMKGLYVGVVTELKDEVGEDRIRIRIPAIDPKGAGVWAKMARQDAGEYRGTFFLPEIDDEVLVGFLNDDPRYPMVLGMLNSSAKPAPVEAGSEDNFKGYYSKVGSRIEFDDTNRKIKIQALGKGQDSKGKIKDYRSEQPKIEKNNTIELNGNDGTILIQDNNENLIQLSQNEIKISAKKKLVLTAKNIEIKASDSLDMEGKKVRSEAKSGEMLIKGKPINLNP